MQRKQGQPLVGGGFKNLQYHFHTLRELQPFRVLASEAAQSKTFLSFLKARVFIDYKVLKYRIVKFFHLDPFH